jgi:acid stress chaperone HdeB
MSVNLSDFAKSAECFMRADLFSLSFAITLLSASLAHGQVSINVSKVTCDQFANGKVGLPRTTAIWLNGYYHGKTGSTTIDTQQSEDMFGKLINFCQTGENGKVPVMQAIEHLLKSK